MRAVRAGTCSPHNRANPVFSDLISLSDSAHCGGHRSTTAIVTAVFAVLAFRKQSSEVQDQASILRVQSSQLAEQRKINDKHLEVLELQATELRATTAVLKHEAELARRAHVAGISITQPELPATLGRADPGVAGPSRPRSALPWSLRLPWS